MLVTDNTQTLVNALAKVDELQAKLDRAVKALSRAQKILSRITRPQNETSSLTLLAEAMAVELQARNTLDEINNESKTDDTK